MKTTRISPIPILLAATIATMAAFVPSSALSNEPAADGHRSSAESRLPASGDTSPASPPVFKDTDPFKDTVHQLALEIEDIRKLVEQFLRGASGPVQTRKIIHLSDLGINRVADRKEKLACIVDHIIAEAMPPSDHIVIITGDLAVTPVESELAYVKTQIGKLTAHGYRILTIPGNHDLALLGQVYDDEYQQRYTEIIEEGKGKAFPRLDIIDNTAFIGLNTMAGRRLEPSYDFATGAIGAGQLQRLDRLLASQAVVNAGYRVVYMHHSPFVSNMVIRLNDAAELKRVLQRHGNVDALLFGHRHTFSHSFNRWGVKRAYNAGASTAENTPVRIIDLESDPEFDAIVDWGCRLQRNHRSPKTLPFLGR